MPMHRSPLGPFTLGLSTFALGLALAGCDAPDDGGARRDEPREGQTTTFKTANQDTSFAWKGCEPPWGDDPWLDGIPPDDWGKDARARIEIDAPALATDAWLRVASGREGHACDVGCASIDLAWTGDVALAETTHEVVGARTFGWCREDLAAWSVDVASESSFDCSCI
jgi:hypothetical protein